MEDNDNRSGSLAAMSVCEALIISLVESGLINWEDMSEMLEAAIDSHQQAEPDGFSSEEHAGAAELIASLLRRMNALGPGGLA